MIADALQRPTSPAGLAPQRPSLFLLYHELTPEVSAYGYALSTASFREQLELFARCRAAADGTLLPLLTFDDGHLSNFEYAMPILSDFGLAARFFITAGWTGDRPEYMNWNQLRQLYEGGHEIGAHGWSHKLLTHCSSTELAIELRNPKQMIEDKLGVPVTTLSFPGGRYNRAVLDACARAGYTQVFTSIPRAESSGSVALPGRLNLRAGATVSWLESVLNPESGALRRMERQYRLKAAAQRVLGDALYMKLWSVLNHADAGEA